ncbi:glycerol-3-phosphate dehydrogenase [NAD(P)+] [Anaeromicropila herbilytica]|uniref:Glycerol-3-phosphate dehydrogenase n=2 Tax=Anaeromicropila herbilytica TaxID=2785025 RepID=A0A7R7ELS1_9FIRM|nr:NAD(P)H-dependent glycerol-3-phosphate dehydrogenase [Anaeromicropila herbilytica]BCN31241.1 glycerol-3-phosphate dehydrogenase [NAD(P)+] [Anaeromicropila herbilytica]
MKVTVIGCGRWGSFIAWYLNHIGQDVILYGREGSKHMSEFAMTRSNGMITLPESIILETNLSKALESEVIIISINSQGLRNVMKEIENYKVKNKKFVLCMKGIEIETGKRLSQIVNETLEENSSVSVWLGPGHVQNFYQGIPNCMVIDSECEADQQFLVTSFSSDLIRFYYGDDMIGSEVGAAAKNVIGIAAGMLDGMNLSSLKGALMSRGTREVARLIKAMGGKEQSAYGLCHLGDYEATVFSKYSHNRSYGEAFVKGQEYTNLAEGYYTVKAMIKLGLMYQVELPICEAVYTMLYENGDCKKVLQELFDRSLKKEF